MTNSEGLCIVEKSPLYAESADIIDKLIVAKDSTEVDNLTAMFKMNQKKKDIVRLDKLNKLTEIVEDEMMERVTCYPDSIDNKDLLSFSNAVQHSINSINKAITEVQPTIQINNTKNEINVNSGLNKESRDRVLAAVKEFMNSVQQDDIIDIDIDKEDA